MKISKTRLLQIIREEVELHEKNTFELEEAELQEILTNEEQNKKTNRQIIDQAIAADASVMSSQENTNSEELEELELNKPKKEDRLFTHNDKKIIEPNNKRRRLEIKIR